MKITDDRILDGLNYLCCQKEICIGAYDLINRQKAEIERLKHRKTELQIRNQELQHEKSESIKEFAERLKGYAKELKIGDNIYLQVVGAGRIDNLVKEMTENITKVEHDSLCETETYKGGE